MQAVILLIDNKDIIIGTVLFIVQKIKRQ
jgi:hypothetical protein